MNNEKDREGPPLLYIYSQKEPHQDVLIVSNKAALLRLKESIEHALKSGEGDCTGVFSDFETYGIKIILNDEQYDSEFWQRLQLPFFEVDDSHGGEVLSVEDMIGFGLKSSEDIRKAQPEMNEYRKYNKEMTEKMKRIAKRNTPRDSQLDYIKILNSNNFKKLDEYLNNHEVNEKVNGESLIYWAVFNNKLPFVKRLLELGADPNQLDTLGRSLLEIASYFGYFEVCKAVLEKGANVNENCLQRSRYSWNSQSQNEIIELLNEWNGNKKTI
ncbi:ankyrin repeat domain-containing protein [Cytobacillus sp. Sa5YUA1]|uniref:Ankyrin repeat domain-containing protein n=1 Tax=Cytobacillus stercorigallinarum TaxID=2762240 RepID=A0ABR8QQ43_9BACI|nr:ankyrin repeat domain-containing protein [Cytobacillus stercorigallinarum]MBD7937613.1 ankyrin repeat domain-containing protein [Cytobacillus stercorigallinarum]